MITDRGAAGERPITRRFGRYELLDRVGEGGMGVVWRAYAPDGRLVAVKVLRTHLAADPQLRMRFEREVTVLSRVRGSHIAEVVEADLDNELPYLVTRYVAGPSLHDVVDAQGPVQGPALKTLALGLLDALQSIHAAGVVHRDLKPGNVLLEDGEPQVIDFGIAQLTHDVRLTMTGMVFGTPGYLAPELLTGSDPTPAGDVHSWGATLAFAATGRPPFGRGALEAVALAVMQRQPDLAGIDRWLEPALAAAMAKDPIERPTAEELIDWFSSGRFGGPPEPGPVTVGPFARSTRAVPALAVADASTWMRPAAAWPEPSPGPAGPALDLSPRSSSAVAPSLPATAAPPPAAILARPADDQPRRVGLRYLSPVVASWWFGWACVTVAAPVLGLAGIAAWVTAAHTTTSARRQLRARTDRGRGANGVVVGLSSPWHVGRGAVVAAAGVAVGAVVAACLLVSLLVVTRIGGLTGVPLGFVLFGVGAVAGLYAWHGFGGESTRSGTVTILRRLTAPRYSRIALSVLGIGLGVAALYVASATTVSFAPLPVPGNGVLDDWSHWFGG